MATMVSGLAAAMGANAPGGDTPDQIAAVSGDNPQQQTPGQQYFSTGNVTAADQALLVRTISEYRDSWAQDRLERIRQWMENVFYWKGIQCIEWDNATNCWYDALAWSRSQGQESGEDTDLERWVNPLVLMFCNVFTGTMSRAVPRTVVKPQNADPALKDIVTAKSAVEAMRIIERKNKMPQMTRSIFEMLFLFGTYFRKSTAAIDGNLFGYDESPVFADMEIQMPARFRCPGCGTETPAQGATSQGIKCPGCGAFLGQESYFGAGEGNRTSLTMVGTQKVPRAGVKWTLRSPLEVDCDPKAKGPNWSKMTPILAEDTEIDLGEARRMFPALYDKIQAGAEVNTTSNASVEKLSRLEVTSALGGMTADNSLSNPTYSQVWMQPMSFHKLGDRAFAMRMEQMFPEGLCLSMVGETVVDIREASLPKTWSATSLYMNQGIYCAALANTAVSFNARFNRVMWILDDWASRAALGLNLCDGARVDTEKMSGKPVPAGTLTSIPMRINGEPRPLAEALAHFELPLNPALWNYPGMLMTFCELIIGIPRQMSGQGTQHDVETLGGQQLQLDRAATTLKPYWENVQEEHAQASQNAFGCLQALMKTGAVRQVRDVIESNGGAWENVEVDYADVQGNVEFSIDADQDLPVDPSQLRAAIQAMFDALKDNNPAAAEWFAVPANQDLALSTLLPGTVAPNEAQELQTLADIQAILENEPQVMMNPDGSQGVELPVHPQKRQNFELAKQVLQRYMLTNFQLRTDEPAKWAMLVQYGDELDQADTALASTKAQNQMKVHQAGMPPKQAPDPTEITMQQEMAELMKQAGPAILRLGQLMQLDPAMTKNTASAQVSAAKEIVDTTVAAGKLAAGAK